jgi:hypothetical protein
MNKTDRLIMYDALTNSEVQIEVATSSDDCCKYKVAWSPAVGLLPSLSHNSGQKS